MNKVSNVHNEESRMEARPAEFVLLGYGCVKHGLKTRATQSFYFMPGALGDACDTLQYQELKTIVQFIAALRASASSRLLESS